VVAAQKADLSVELCGVRFESPFVLAAGPPSDDLDMLRAGLAAGWAGAVLKTTSVEGTKVDLANPIISGLDVGKERAAALGNIDLISVHHIDEVGKRIEKLKGEFPDRVIAASISGADEVSWQDVARRAATAGADLIEASFSCPQGGLGQKPRAMLAQDPEASARVCSWIKDVAGATPVVIKLTPQVADIAEIALAVKGAGADAVCVGNTIPALMGVDLDDFVPIPQLGGSSTYCGLSGPAIKPMSLRCVAEVAGRARMPVVASGGAADWRDALEFVLLGASVVQFCTAVMHRGFGIVEGFIDGMASHLEAKGIGSLDEIRGAALSKIVDHDELPRKEVRAVIDEKACVRCGMCHVSCRDGAHRAIDVGEGGLPAVDDGRCTGCGLCAAICPAKCIEMREAGRGRR